MVSFGNHVVVFLLVFVALLMVVCDHEVFYCHVYGIDEYLWECNEYVAIQEEILFIL